MLTDDTQAVVWKGEYDPFGKVTETVSTVEQNLRFPGQYYDEETGLHYNYFRTYDPDTGRYVTSDPIGLGGGLSTYGYAASNPIVFSDRLGLAVDSDPYRGPLYGTWVHTRFTQYVNSIGLIGNISFNTFGRYRPDAIDPSNGSIWELKPSNCVSGYRRRNAEKQLDRYIEEGNKNSLAEIGVWHKGDSSRLLPSGSATVQSVYNGTTINITFYPDSISNSGLIYYRTEVVQTLGSKIGEAIIYPLPLPNQSNSDRSMCGC